MLIGIDASRANRDHKSGTEWYSYYLIRNLAAIDDKNEYILYTDQPLRDGMVDLCLSDNKSINYRTSPDDINYDSQGFQKLKSPYGNFKAKVLKWPFGVFWTQGRMSLEMLLHRPQVLFIPAHTLPFIHPSKSVVTIHDIGFARDLNLYRRQDFQGQDLSRRTIVHGLARLFTLGKYRAEAVDYLKWSTEFAIKHARRVITISDFTQAEIKRFYHNCKDNFTTVLNGYNSTLYTGEAAAEKVRSTLDRYGIEDSYLLYVGRIDKKKNISRLVEAFYFFKQQNPKDKTKLVLVGDAMYGFDELKYQLREYDMVNEVIITGWAEERDLPALYQGSVAFVFPSKYEGFGIPILQAMASGVPVLASNAASIPEVAGGAALLFDPDDAQAIAAAFKLITQDKEKRAQLVAVGLKRVQKFSWRQCAADTLRVLESL